MIILGIGKWRVFNGPWALFLVYLFFMLIWLICWKQL